MTFHSQFSLQLLPKWQTMCYRESSFMLRPKFSASFALPCWLCIYSHTLHYWALSKHKVLIQSSSPAVRQPATPTLNRGRWPREIGQGSSKPVTILAMALAINVCFNLKDKTLKSQKLFPSPQEKTFKSYAVFSLTWINHNAPTCPTLTEMSFTLHTSQQSVNNYTALWKT